MAAGENKQFQDTRHADAWTYQHQHNLTALDEQAIDDTFKHSVRFYRALLAEYLPPDKNVLIMDLPCGEGRMVYALKEMGYHNVQGYDLDTARLLTGQKLGLPLLEGDCFRTLAGQKDNSIDMIVSMDFLEHLEKNEVIDFLKQAAAKTAPGGTFVVRTPCADNPFGIRHIYNDFTHKWAATSGVLEQLLHSAGFAETVVFGEDPNSGMRFGAVRMMIFRIATGAANLFTRALGQGSLDIWTPSMWAVARNARR
ncbi:MAG: class I SAM-dependent methyltransferase [Deltaproteobacteria bacterium]|nr:class I SAM-dependent methyltransferase [Deltaproteobacteria bacterium]